MRFARWRTSRRPLQFEQLEERLALSASIGSLDGAVAPVLGAKWKPTGSSSPVGLTPAQVRTAYHFNNINFDDTVGDGAGQTIAIVDAHNDPNIVSDLAVFDQTFGLPDPPSLTVVNQNGGAKLPTNSRSWAQEIAIDVEWAHAIAPAANILLVEANSSSNLGTAIDYARNAPGVTVVSVSAGGKEFKSEHSADALLTTPAGHVGITFVFAAGDKGGKAEYPSSSPNVLSVGGTTLDLTSSDHWSNETVWAGGGGGISKYEGVPSYQNGLGLSARGTPDVTYDGDPGTGFAVYDSYGTGGWAQFGGTSAGTPQWAALLAIADQGRVLDGESPLANAQAALYAMPPADFHDIVTGSNGFSAAPGYDLASGLGSPIANLLIDDLVEFDGSTDFTVAALASGNSGTSTNHFASHPISLEPAAVPAGHSSMVASLRDSVALSFGASRGRATRTTPLNATDASPPSSSSRLTTSASIDEPQSSVFKDSRRSTHLDDELELPATMADANFHGIDTFFASLAG